MPLIGGIDLRLAYQFPGKLSQGHVLHCPSIRAISDWDLRQVFKKFRLVCRV